MYNFPIGAIVGSFRKASLFEGVDAAAAIGAQGIQMMSKEGQQSPYELVGSARCELLNYVKDKGMVFTALCGSMPYGFGNPEQNPTNLEMSKRILDLARELETDVYTTHIGVVPSDKNHDRYKIMQEACAELAEYAASIGSYFAIETGPEMSETLKGFLDGIGSKGIAVNFDPANLVMVVGDDPVKAVHNLKDYIVHTHAKDGNRLVVADSEIVYKVRQPMPPEYVGVKFYEEVPLGTGSVDFVPYLKALEEIGYKGFLTIEREVGQDPAADIKTAMDYLKKTIAEN